jgi:hypothetical protein
MRPSKEQEMPVIAGFSVYDVRPVMIEFPLVIVASIGTDVAESFIFLEGPKKGVFSFRYAFSEFVPWLTSAGIDESFMKAQAVFEAKVWLAEYTFAQLRQIGNAPVLGRHLELVEASDELILRSHLHGMYKDQFAQVINQTRCVDLATHLRRVLEIPRLRIDHLDRLR